MVDREQLDVMIKRRCTEYGGGYSPTVIIARTQGRSETARDDEAIQMHSTSDDSGYSPHSKTYMRVSPT